MTVLVGYASAHGCTRAVAERIAAKLAEHGLDTEVHALQPHRETGAYNAFVLGSAIHRSSWLPVAGVYVHRNSDLLAGHPVWLFSTGIAHVTGRTAQAGPIEPRQLPHYRQVLKPQEYHLFAGAVERDHFGPLERLRFRVVGGRYGDYRDWKDIDAWAESIARQLTPTG